nr:hypothetical protein [Tanacetum cinerariifolium]
MQQPMQNPKDISDPTTAFDMALALMAKAFTLNDTIPTNNNQRSSSNLSNMQIAQPDMNMDQDRQMLMVEDNVGNQFRPNVVQNIKNQYGNRNVVTVLAKGNGNGINAAADAYEETKRVKVNCILENNLPKASTSGTQSDKAPVYDTDGSTEYTELLEPIPEPHQVPPNDSNVISKVSSMEQDLNKQLSKEKSTVSFLLKEKKKLKSDFKTREDELLDKQIQPEKKIKELMNILVKIGQSIQTIHMLSPKLDSFYHTEQKMALGYQNSFYLKQAQKKKQCLYDGKVLLEKHDPPVVHDSKETLQLA